MSNHRQILSTILANTQQTHLLNLVEKCTDENKLKYLASQIEHISNCYDGGLEAYVKKGRELVHEFRTGIKDLPQRLEKPANINKISLNAEFEELEERGRNLIGQTGFVLVAGGLGERLGSKDIKISLVCELMSEITFMDLYMAYMKEFSSISGKKAQLFIMTSNDTHDKTVAFLQQRQYDDYLEITIGKQDKVPSFSDMDSNVDVNPETFELTTKPHGHGDVHFLIKKNKVLENWKHNHGLKYAYFFQDTNPFSLPNVPVMLGVTEKNRYLFNYMAISRKPGESVGALITDEKGRTFNIEYNIVKKVLDGMGATEEVNCEGFSYFPGNINVFLIEIDEYMRILDNMSGLKEFINPKADKTNPNKLLSSFRLECLMQDIVLAIDDHTKVGVTEFERALAFTTCKNDLNTGAQLQKNNLSSETIIELEHDIYYRNFLILQYCGVTFNPFTMSMNEMRGILSVKELTYCSIKVQVHPKIFIHPTFGVLIKDLRSQLKNVHIDGKKEIAMVLKGRCLLENCTFSSTSLWLENNSPRPLKLNNLTLISKEESVIKFMTMSHQEIEETDNYAEAMRGYRVCDKKKFMRICN